MNKVDLLVAFAHIGGTVVVSLVLGFLFLAFGAWWGKKIQKAADEEASIALGVSVAQLNDEKLIPRIIQLSSERFSRELLKNRISDLCGLVRTLWNGLGSLLSAGVLLAVIWYTIKDGLNNAAFAWTTIGISLFFSFVSVVFSLTCRLITGRFPGEASMARKNTAEFLRNRDTHHDDSDEY